MYYIYADHEAIEREERRARQARSELRRIAREARRPPAPAPNVTPVVSDAQTLAVYVATGISCALILVAWLVKRTLGA